MRFAFFPTSVVSGGAGDPISRRISDCPIRFGHYLTASTSRRLREYSPMPTRLPSSRHRRPGGACHGRRQCHYTPHPPLSIDQRPRGIRRGTPPWGGSGCGLIQLRPAGGSGCGLMRVWSCRRGLGLRYCMMVHLLRIHRQSGYCLHHPASNLSHARGRVVHYPTCRCNRAFLTHRLLPPASGPPDRSAAATPARRRAIPVREPRSCPRTNHKAMAPPTTAPTNCAAPLRPIPAHR